MALVVPGIVEAKAVPQSPVPMPAAMFSGPVFVHHHDRSLPTDLVLQFRLSRAKSFGGAAPEWRFAAKATTALHKCSPKSRYVGAKALTVGSVRKETTFSLLIIRTQQHRDTRDTAAGVIHLAYTPKRFHRDRLPNIFGTFGLPRASPAFRERAPARFAGFFANALPRASLLQSRTAVTLLFRAELSAT